MGKKSGRLKIALVTGSRAEYGLLYPLAKLIKNDNECDLRLMVTGSHLSPEFGLIYKQIEKDGFDTFEKVEIQLSSESPIGMAKTIGMAVSSFSEVFSRINPDCIVVLGDRYEILGVCIAAFVLQIPIVHLHGGELTEGALDDGFRHCITKLSSLHLVSHPTYKDRVIQLGENPNTVHVIGSIGVDTAKHMHPIKKISLEREFNITIDKDKTIILTYNPETISNKDITIEFKAILEAIDSEKLNVIFTFANADTKGNIINTMIKTYLDTHKNCIAVYTMGHLKYLSCLRYVLGIVGNSSSGIIEAPVLKIGTVNIGDRQTGRIMAESVVCCAAEKSDIINAIKKLLTKEFKSLLEVLESPQEGEDVSQKALNLIKNTDFIIKKKFYNIKGV